MCQHGGFASAQEPPAVAVDRGTGHELGDRAGDRAIPGATQLTRTCGASARASDLVGFTSPALAAAWCMWCGAWVWAATLATVTMTAPGRTSGAGACRAKKAPLRLTSRTFCHSWTVIWPKG